MKPGKEIILAAFVTLVSAALAFVFAEAVLAFRLVRTPPITPQGFIDVKELARQSAAERRVPYDTRSSSQVIEQLRAEGYRAFPAISPRFFLEPAPPYSKVQINGKPILPLGIAAHARNVYCNEGGFFAAFDTDRFGLRNPDAVWNRSIDYVAVGDSFTFGSCLEEADSVIGQLRARLESIANLGSGANGPLLELATIKEFVPSLKPKVVLWLFFPNDLDDLSKELLNPLLAAYLEPGHTQHLMEVRALYEFAVEQAAEEYHQAVKNAELAGARAGVVRWYTFRNVRSLFAFAKNRIRSEVANKPDLDLMLNVLAEARRTVRISGAAFHFIYLPDCTGESYGQSRWKTELVESVRSLGINVIDTEEAVLAARSDGKQPFYFCHGSHFSPTGASAAARAILAGLAAEDALPKKTGP